MNVASGSLASIDLSNPDRRLYIENEGKVFAPSSILGEGWRVVSGGTEARVGRELYNLIVENAENCLFRTKNTNGVVFYNVDGKNKKNWAFADPPSKENGLRVRDIDPNFVEKHNPKTTVGDFEVVEDGTMGVPEEKLDEDLRYKDAKDVPKASETDHQPVSASKEDSAVTDTSPLPSASLFSPNKDLSRDTHSEVQSQQMVTTTEDLGKADDPLKGGDSGIGLEQEESTV